MATEEWPRKAQQYVTVIASAMTQAGREVVQVGRGKKGLGGGTKLHQSH